MRTRSNSLLAVALALTGTFGATGNAAATQRQLATQPSAAVECNEERRLAAADRGACRRACGEGAEVQACFDACHEPYEELVQRHRDAGGCAPSRFAEPEPPTEQDELVLDIVHTPRGSFEAYLEVVDTDLVLEGDIVVGSLLDEAGDSDDQLATVASATRRKSSARWPGGVVPYRFGSGFSTAYRAEVRNAMDRWEADTNNAVTFREDRGVGYAFRHGLVLVLGSRYRSSVGFVRSGSSSSYQTITLKGGTFEEGDREGVIMHELGHTLGLYHEQSRHDRDDHINVLWKNVAGKAGNFDKYEDRGFWRVTDGADVGPFDFDSLMLYASKNHLSKLDAHGNRLDTMVKKNGDPFPRQQNGPSPGDIAAIRAMYAQGAVHVAWSDGNGRFKQRQKWADWFCVADEICQAGDVNGDGRDDIVAFVGNGEVWVALAKRTKNFRGGYTDSSGFFSPKRWHNKFHYRSATARVADVTGDGKADIITFNVGTDGSVYVARSTGTSFKGTGWKWADRFCFKGEVVRVGDVDGDGDDDAVCFKRGSHGRVIVARSNRNSFAAPGLWLSGFCTGWGYPALGNVDGDRRGRDDAVCFTRGKSADVHVARSNGNGFYGASKWHNYFAPNKEIPGIADVNGDGKDDIVTFTRGTSADVYVSRSNGRRFLERGWRWHTDFCRGESIPLLGRFGPDKNADILEIQR